MTRLWRIGVHVAVDLTGTLFAASLAFIVRFAFDASVIPSEHIWVYIRALPVILLSRVALFYAFGLYNQVWSYASVNEMARILWAVTADTVVSIFVIFAVATSGFPRSVIAISWFLNIGALGVSRLALRLRREWRRASSVTPGPLRQTLIFGAGDAGAMLAREYAKHAELGCQIVGFIDDDPYKQRASIAGKKVLGTREDLRSVVQNYAVTDLVIAMPSARGPLVRDVVELANKLGLQVKTVPGLFEFVNGTANLSHVRDVQIEDVLGREEVKTDLQAIAAFLSGETVLVTGAGGSIGSELCRQIACFAPRRLLLLGHGENSVYEINMELRKKYPDLDIVAIIADVQDRARIRALFQQHRPSVVFHAAAHKHVPLMEQNPEEAIKNNIFGTQNVAAAAHAFKVKRFVLISSDKAVNPTSVMGATKRGAECVIQSLANVSETTFVAVRFGNVLGSRGSVIPLFKRQIASGGPVTVTDARMLRYFMTIPEAVQLVIQAASMGKGGEIFVLDMGKPVRILDLARDLIRLSGFEPEVDIPIVFTGIRDGEKLYEELLTASEGTVATVHERIFIARGDSISSDDLEELVACLREMIAHERVSNDRLREAVARTGQGREQTAMTVGR